MTSAVQYAIVGTGSIGAVLAQRFSDHHVPALFANTRGPETIDVTELSASITPVTLDTALDADVIILAIPFLQVRELGGRRADWSGKIVVDTTNAFLVPNSEKILGGRLSTDFNAEAFPGAAVVKSFNQTAARQLAEDRPSKFGRRVVFVSSNDSAASTRSGRAVHRSRLRPDRTRTYRRGRHTHPGPQRPGLARISNTVGARKEHSGGLDCWAGSQAPGSDDRPPPLPSRSRSATWR